MNSFDRYAKYRLYDIYGEKEPVFFSNDLDAIKRAARLWHIEETDGECELICYKRYESDRKWHIMKDFTY